MYLGPAWSACLDICVWWHLVALQNKRAPAAIVPTSQAGQDDDCAELQK